MISDRVIVLELNELTPTLMDKFIAAGHLPGGERLRAESIVAVSDAQEQAPALEPWIQWVTVHTGLSYADHKVFLLGDGDRLDAQRTWDMVADAGKRAWICGSMNAAIRSKRVDNLHVLPDPWSTGISPKPDGMFDPYFRYVQSQVQEYTRETSPCTKGDAIRFAMFMAKNGLSARTAAEIVRQLFSERISDSRWQRAAILDRLQWDVFRHFYGKLDPTFSTFFLNSTAHYQHYYWRNMDPTAFALRDSGERQTRFAEAILFGYQRMDQIVKECLRLADEKTTVVLATGLGQQPLTKYDETGGKQLYKPIDIGSVLRFSGSNASYSYAPVMAEEFNLLFESEAAAAESGSRLHALRMGDGYRVLNIQVEGMRLHCGCQVHGVPARDARVYSSSSNEAMGFYDLFYPVEGIKSGMHHPDGILWYRLPDRVHSVVKRKVPLQEIAPTLLELCGVSSAGRFPIGPTPEIVGARNRPHPTKRYPDRQPAAA